ncbi:MAG TPA: glycosyltransferase [Gaiellaceae bacterium]|nr:glycosyltransferase [Gaiellaceae bacterium]
MRIALLDPPSYSPAYDHHLASALAERGHDVELLTSPFAFGEPPQPGGYRRSERFLPLSSRLLRRSPRSRLRVPLKAVEYVPSVALLLARLRRSRPDVVHAQWLPLGRRDLVWARRLPRPRVLTAHNVLPHSGEADAEERRALYGAFDRIVVHTRGGAEQLAEFGVPAQRVVRIPHGTFHGPPAWAVEPPTGRTLLFFGLIRRYKGLDVLVRALAEVPDAQLVVAGDPLDPVEPLRALAGELGVADRIEWRLGYLPQEEVERLMRQATLAVFPYRGGESASGALATALGHGRPAVVSDVLGEVVAEYGAGAVVPREDAGALAAAIRELLDDPAALERAYRGTEDARRALSWDAIAEAHEQLYSDLLAKVGGL